jgi:hypothetical protein
MAFRDSRWMFALEDAWEVLKKSYWLNFLILVLVLALWCCLVAYATRDQLIPGTIPGQAGSTVKDYVWYWLGIVAFWMFQHGWYTLIFVFRNQSTRLGQYWWWTVSGLLLLVFAYSFYFLLGMGLTLFPLFNETYRALLQGATAQSRNERGGDLLSSHQAERRYRRVRPRDDRGVLWGGVRIPTAHAVTNFMVVGTVGSGKTLTIQLLLQSLLIPEGETSNHETET